MPFRGRHTISAREHIHQCDVESFPVGVKLFMWSRFVRWIGWGFGESLIPIFLFSFSVSYAEAGLLNSIYNISLLCALPIIGALADRMSARTLVVIALAAYPFVGLSYFFAGLTGLALFIIIARGLNGITWALETTGIDTYYRRTTNRECLASSFGFIETWANLGWILAALAGIFLIHFFPVHYLLLAVVPFSLFALFIALRVPKDAVRKTSVTPLPSLHSYADALNEFRGWNLHLHLLAVLVLFMGIVSTLVNFFVPINAYTEGADLSMVIVLGVVATIPALFGFPLGKIADTHNKYILASITLLLSAVVVGGLAIFPQYWFKLLASFLLGIFSELLIVTGKSLITTLGSKQTYGLRGSVFESVSTLGKLAAPLLIGISLDLIGFSNMSLVVAVVAVVLGIGFASLERNQFRAT